MLGLEFSGCDSSGRRVMGLVPARGLATTVSVDPEFLWEVPQHWTLEEAASVPVVYATAYYALVVRGRLQPGQSVLIHSGEQSARSGVKIREVNVLWYTRVRSQGR